MTGRTFQIVGLLTAAALAAGLCSVAFAAPKRSSIAVQSQKKAVAKKEVKKDELPISAPHAILIDAENGGVLFEGDPDRLIFPAALGRLMTVEYVFHQLKEGPLQATDQFQGGGNAE